MSGLINWLSQNVLLPFISPADTHKNRRAFWLWALILLLSGGLAWMLFLNRGLGPYQYHDWADITIPRLTFLQNAVRQGVLPLHIADGGTLGGITDRFLSVPDVFSSPQFILLRWLDIGPFMLANFLLLYGVGFAGMVAIALRKQLSPLALTVLFLLFNFNGHMLAHISVGHYTWSASFLFPWLVMLVFDLLDGPAGWQWVLKVAGLMFVVLLQGGYHQFVYSLFLLALLIPAVPRQALTLVYALVFSVLVSAARTLPPVINLGIFDNKFLAGYPFSHTILNSLVNVYLPGEFTQNMNLTREIGTWEYALFVGIPAAVVLGWCGLVSVYRARHESSRDAALLLPVVGLALLSLDRVYQFLREALPLPLVTGERVPARFAFLALILVMVLAVIHLQKWLNRRQAAPTFAFILIGVILMIANDLWQNFHLWRIPVAAKSFHPIYTNPANWAVANHPDAAYFNLLLAGSAITVLAFTGLVVLSLRRPKPAPEAGRPAG